jgi:hypothetical protein
LVTVLASVTVAESVTDDGARPEMSSGCAATASSGADARLAAANAAANVAAAAAVLVVGGCGAADMRTAARAAGRAGANASDWAHAAASATITREKRAWRERKYTRAIGTERSGAVSSRWMGVMRQV